MIFCLTRMVNKCVSFGCSSGYHTNREKVSTFSFPLAKSDLLKKWGKFVPIYRYFYGRRSDEMHSLVSSIHSSIRVQNPPPFFYWIFPTPLKQLLFPRTSALWIKLSHDRFLPKSPELRNKVYDCLNFDFFFSFAVPL